MTLMKVNRKLFYFAHIPKTGGSSIETAMREAGAKRALHFHKRLDFVRCNLQHMHAELFDTFIPPTFYAKGFCVIRHPVTRLVSEYRWRQNLKHVRGGFDAWVNEQLARYADDPYILDNHMRPQVEFIGKKITVFRFEDGIPHILSEVGKMTGLTLDTQTHKRAKPHDKPITWSPETRTAVLKFYERDFRELGYDYDIDLPQLSIDR